MSRFRSYGYSRGSSVYLSRRDEYFLTDEEKQAKHERRSAAAASKNKAVSRPLMPYRPAGPTDWEKALAAEAAQATASAQATAQLAPEMPAPQTADMFADLVDEEEDEVGEAPAP